MPSIEMMLGIRRSKLGRIPASSFFMKNCPYCANSIQDAAIKCRYCGARLDPPASVPSSASQTVGSAVTGGAVASGPLLASRYKIVRELGRGGMAVVYLAEDAERQNAPVAIKVLSPQLSGDAAALQRFRWEADIAMSLSHPNIVRLHNLDVDRTTDSRFLVMEYVRGASLAEILKLKGKLDWNAASRFLAQVLEGLSYAHSRSVVHRDLKPANVLVDETGVAKISDFGIARQLQDSLTVLTGRTSLGTLLYMAPEQVTGGASDARTDLYATGAVLYEMLAGAPPFSTGSIEWQIMNKDPDPIPGQPDKINALIRRAMAKAPAQRFSTAQEFLSALSGAPVSLPALLPAAPIPAAIGPRPLKNMARPKLPVISDERALCALLGISPRELNWLSDPYRLLQRPHYIMLARPKRNGGRRLLLAPKKKLKQVQSLINQKILAAVEPSSWAHGFTTGRSILTNVTAHVGREIVVKMDLRQFFHTITLARVRGLFRSLKFPEPVSRSLALLCTCNPGRIPPSTKLVVKKNELQEAFCPGTPRGSLRAFKPVLPQGAPTSPAIANLVARALDRRLAALSRQFGAAYTRYADDLTFSGGPDFHRDLDEFIPRAVKIIRQEQFVLAREKLRVIRKGNRQRVTGIVVNKRPNVAREELRSLRAILHNCLKHGPATQNRDNVKNYRSHLQGRIAFVKSVNPAQGEKLLGVFKKIQWP